MIKSVLFDMDGVLIDSFDICFDSFNFVLSNFGYKTFDKKEYRKRFWGFFIERDFKIATKANDDKINEMVKFYTKNYPKFIKEIKVYDNVPDVLKKMKKQKLKLAVITSTLREVTKKILLYFKLLKFFDVIVCGDDVKNPKPEPDMIFEACKKLNVRPEECLVVGDTESDEKAAKAANSKFILVRNENDLKKIISKLP